MWRNILGSLLALLGAALALGSVFFDWYGSRDGRRFELYELFTGDGITADSASLFEGLFLAMLVAAALAVAAMLLRSRLLMLLSGIVALGITILWMVRQYQVADSLTVGQGGLKVPVFAALAAGVLLLISAAGMAGRHVRERPVVVAPPTAGPAPVPEAGEVRRGPWPRDERAPERGHGEDRDEGRGREAA